MGYGYNGRAPVKSPAKPKVENNPQTMEFPFFPGFFPWLFFLPFIFPFFGGFGPGYGGFGPGYGGYYGAKGRK